MSDAYLPLAMAMLLFPVFLQIAAIISCFVHELGHAVVALLFNYKNVEIFVGRHASNDNYHVTDLQLLKIHFLKNLFQRSWSGYCRFQRSTQNYYQLLLLSAAGVLASTGYTAYCLYKIVNLESGPFSFSFLIAVLVTYVIEISNNFSPKDVIRTHHHLEYVDNDGYSIKSYWFFIRNGKELERLEALENREDYASAAAGLEALYQKYKDSEYLYRHLIVNYAGIGNKQQASKYLTLFAKKFLISTEDALRFIELCNMLQLDDLAILFAKNAFKLDPDHEDILGNYAYAHFQKENYQEALTIFKKLLDKNVDHILLRSFVAFLQYKLEGDKTPILSLAAEKLDGEESITTLYLIGRYYLDEKNYQMAIDYLERSLAAEPHAPIVQEYLAKAKAQASSDLA